MLIFFFFHRNRVHYYVTLTSSWQPKISRLSSDFSLTRMISTKHKALLPPEVSLHSTSALNSKSSTYTTIKLYSLTHLEKNKNCHIFTKGLNKQKLTSTEVCFHCSNAKVTPSLQILLKAYNKLSKTTNL